MLELNYYIGTSENPLSWKPRFVPTKSIQKLNEVSVRINLSSYVKEFKESHKADVSRRILESFERSFGRGFAALAGGLGGGAVMSPVGPGQSCDGGPGGKPPRSSKDLVL